MNDAISGDTVKASSDAGLSVPFPTCCCTQLCTCETERERERKDITFRLEVCGAFARGASVSKRMNEMARDIKQCCPKIRIYLLQRILLDDDVNTFTMFLKTLFIFLLIKKFVMSLIEYIFNHIVKRHEELIFRFEKNFHTCRFIYIA